MNIGSKKIIYRKTVDGLFLYLFGKEEMFIAGKEFKGNLKEAIAVKPFTDTDQSQPPGVCVSSDASKCLAVVFINYNPEICY